MAEWLLWIIALAVLLFGFVVFFGAPYIPSKRRELRRVFTELYPLTRHDVLVDIGSGDGVVLRAAALKGAKAVGYEINPLLVYFSRWLSRNLSGVSVQLANVWRIHFPRGTTVAYVFSVSRDQKKLVRKLQAEANYLKHPLKCISYGFELPGKIPIKKMDAYFLYDFIPLQGEKT